MTSAVPLISRRAFLRVGAGAITLVGVSLLGACAEGSAPPQATQPAPRPAPTAAAAPTSAPPTLAPAAVAPTATSGGARAAVKLPTYVPLAGITPDIPASSDGLLDAGFVNYPADPVKTVRDTPGRGGEISAVTWTTSPAPTPMECNSLWQAVNKELGVTLRINIHAQADYGTVKLPTIVAGNELPDIVYIATNTAIPQLPTFFQSKMADLTPYLSGDAIKDYANLAAIPTIAWRSMVFNNAIYGIPCANSLFLWVHWVHHELLEAEGLSDPRTADDYRKLAIHFTRPDQNLWGLGAENSVGMGMTNGWMTGIFGAPNGWALDEQYGRLTYTAETEPYKAAVSYARDLWAAGAYHPNSLQYNLVSARNDMAARRFMFRMDGFGVASNLFWAQDPRHDPPGDARVVPPFPAVDGGKPTYWTTPGILGYSVIKQAPPERIKEILRVLNWLAAPFGTQEYLLKTYGLKDIHWTPDDKGNPILNDRGKPDATVPFHYLTRAPTAMYWPATPDKTPGMHAVQKAYHPYMSLNPTDGFYSETNSSKLPALTQDLVQSLNDIVVGRQPLSPSIRQSKTGRTAGAIRSVASSSRRSPRREADLHGYRRRSSELARRRRRRISHAREGRAR